MGHITIFKTSVNTNRKIRRVKGILNGIKEIDQWNFDLEDCDNILRIESRDNTITAKVSQNLQKMGYLCIELN